MPWVTVPSKVPVSVGFVVTLLLAPAMRINGTACPEALISCDDGSPTSMLPVHVDAVTDVMTPLGRNTSRVLVMRVSEVSPVRVDPLSLPLNTL